MKKMIFTCAVAALALSWQPASAADQECTEEAAAERQTRLMTYLQENEEKGPEVMKAIEEVEAEYGGDPTDEQTCEALDKVMAKIGLE